MVCFGIDHYSHVHCYKPTVWSDALVKIHAWGGLINRAEDNIGPRLTWEVSPYSFKHRFTGCLWPKVMVSAFFISSYGNCNCRSWHFESQGSLSVPWLWGFSSLLGFWRLPLFNNGIETLAHCNNVSMAQHLYKESNYISLPSYG